jgi:hypothetical protein
VHGGATLAKRIDCKQFSRDSESKLSCPARQARKLESAADVLATLDEDSAYLRDFIAEHSSEPQFATPHLQEIFGYLKISERAWLPSKESE